MKIYRKVLAVLLALSMLCSFGVMSVNAENETETAVSETAEVTLETSIPSEIQRMMTVLKVFNIIPEYYDYNIPLQSEVSRSDFAVAVARMMGKTVYNGSAVYFYDLTKNYWAYDEISNLAEMEILSGSGDGTFNPGEPITKSAAYTILLSAMGYRVYAESLGGYPKGYTSVASRIKLAKGVSGSEMLTMSDMLNILYNALTVNIVEISFATLDGMTYGASDTETLISKYRNIYYEEGTVSGANCITLTGSSLKKDETVIDGETYKSEGFNMIDYLGEKVEFFYEKKDLEDYKKLLWVGHRSSAQNIKNISVDGDAKLDTDTFIYTCYDKDGKKHKVNIDRSAVLIYNGSVIESGYDKILNATAGNNKRYDLKLIETDGKYKVMIVREYKNYIVGNINSGEFKVYDKNVPSDFVNLQEEDYDTFSIKLMGRDDMSFEDITKDTVLTVYQSKKHMEVLVSRNLVEGVITGIEKHDYKEVAINGTKYRVDDKVADSSYGMGDDVTAYTNVYGEVVYIVVKSSDYEGAFLLSTKFKSKEDATYVKLLGENSKVVSIKCAEKVVIDGTRYKDAEQAYLGILDGKEKLTAQFAIIKKNSNGEIKEIDTIKPDNANGNSNSLQVDVPFKYDDEDSETLRQIRANSNTARMGAKIVFDENTKVFIVPNVTSFDNVRDEELWATVGSKLVNDTGAYAQSYRTSESIGVAKYVLLKDYEPSKANAELPILAQKIYTGLDDDGEIVEILKGYQGNASVDIKADDSNSNLFSSKKVSAGDVITLKRDSYGNVIDCTVKYKYSLGKLLESSELNAVMGVFAGYANSVVDNVVKIGYTSGADFDFAVNATSKPVLLFDASETKNPISVATTGDIVTYKNSPTRCSKVVIVTSRMQPQLLVIYK